VARAALAELATVSEQAQETAAALSSRLEAVRHRAYALVDKVAPADATEERLHLRAQALLLGVEATSTLVAAVGGRAMTGDHPAQRWAREAMFHLVFAQTSAAKAASLAWAQS
jgi:alkylation response protein AidB-like acyl-CoA dehydrogenase